MRPIQWRQVIASALAGWCIALGILGWKISDVGNGNPVAVVAPGQDGPSSQAFEDDFPGIALPDGTGHDGQQFYAIARNPWHIDEAADNLGRPSYRLGRPLLPWLGWALHPSGGGIGLVRALIVVGALATLLFGIIGGAFADHLGRSPRWAAVFPALPGAVMTLWITVADVLALGLGLAAVLALQRRRPVLAWIAGAAAMLAKESIAVVLAPILLLEIVGVIRRREDQSIVESFWRCRATHLGIGMTLPWVLWSILVRSQVGRGTTVVEFTPPFLGMARSWGEVWIGGDHLVAAVMVHLSFGLAAWALLRSARTALWWTTLAQAVFTSVLGLDVLSLDLNGPRTTLPLLTVALLTILERRATSDGPAERTQATPNPERVGNTP